jgi:phage tail sheath protein FI
MGALVGISPSLLSQTTDINKIPHSKLDKVNARSIIDEIKNDIEKICEYYKYEVNDRVTRQSLSSSILNLINEKYVYSGLICNFKIIIDETNNSPQNIDSGNLYGTAYVQLNKSLEFIVIDFVIGKDNL